MAFQRRTLLREQMQFYKAALPWLLQSQTASQIISDSLFRSPSLLTSDSSLVTKEAFPQQLAHLLPP